jgi:hypothetical protein
MFKKGFSPMQERGSQYGLLHFIGSGGTYGFSISKDELENTRTMMNNPMLTEDDMHEDLYIGPNADMPTTYLNCSPDLASLHPICEEHFEDKGRLIDVMFTKKKLPEWKTIKEEAIQLLDSFIKK